MMDCLCEDLKQPGKVLLNEIPLGVDSNCLYLERSEYLEETYYITAVDWEGNEDFVEVKYCHLCGRKLKEDK